MPDPSERDEPSFVTNVERSLDPRVPSPLGPPKLPSAEEEPEEGDATEVGTVPGPRLHRLHDDADEPVENTEILAAPDASAHLAHLPPMRPLLDSEAAGHWQAPAPNGAPLPISSDTAALHRPPVFPSAPPPLYAPPQPQLGPPPQPHAPSGPSAPALASTPPRRRRGSAIYLFWFLVVGVIGGAGIALKLGIVRRGKSAAAQSATVSATAAPVASVVAAAPPASAAPPVASEDVVSSPEAGAPSAAPTTEPSAAPAASGRHGRPRRPRRGK